MSDSPRASDIAEARRRQHARLTGEHREGALGRGRVDGGAALQQGERDAAVSHLDQLDERARLERELGAARQQEAARIGAGREDVEQGRVVGGAQQGDGLDLEGDAAMAKPTPNR